MIEHLVRAVNQNFGKTYFQASSKPLQLQILNASGCAIVFTVIELSHNYITPRKNRYTR